jgi:excisionase family DNA binding protein
MAFKHSTPGRRTSDGRTPKLETRNPDDSEVMSLDEAAEFLKCCTATLKRRAKLLHIPHKRIGSLWRFYRPALVAWMEEDGNFAA